MVNIIHIKDYADIARTKRLFIEFSSCLDFAALFLGVQNELEDHPSAYIPPEGCLLLAEVDLQVVGCSAVRRIDRQACELKRLYVLPGFRRRGIGRTLTGEAVTEAAKLGYKTMHLETLPSMKDAVDIYTALGFELVEPEEDDRSTKALYMKLALSHGGPTNRVDTR